MRVRSLAVIAGVFLTAALLSVLVVRQLSDPGAEPAAAAPTPAGLGPAVTPPLDEPAVAADGLVELFARGGEAPLAGAEVRLYLALPPDRGHDEPTVAPRGEARTDTAGVARIPARAGTYLAAVRAGGLGTAYVEVLRVPGEEVTRAEVALAPATSLEARVTARPGEPGRGPRRRVPRRRARRPARPAVRAAGGAGRPRPRAQTARSASRGSPPGTYAVAAEGPELHPILLPRVVVPREGALAIALEPLGRVLGLVRDAAGRPAAGATVRGASRDHEGTATAGADGRFTLALPAGSYRVSARAASRRRRRSDLRAVRRGHARPRARARARGLRGGVVLDARSGRPVPARSSRSPRTRPARSSPRTAADADGRFRLARLAPGEYDLRAAAPGRSPALQRGVTLGPGATFPLRVALAGTGAIEGVVEDARGGALAGARVRIVARGDGLAGARARGAERLRGPLPDRGGGDRARRARRAAGRRGSGRRARCVSPRTARAARTCSCRRPGLVVARDPGWTPGAGGHRRRRGPARGGRGRSSRAASQTPRGATASRCPRASTGSTRRPATPTARICASRPRSRGSRPGRPRLDVAAIAPTAEEGVEVIVLEPGGAPSPGAVVTLARADDERIALATSAGDDGRVVLAAEMGLAGAPVTVRARSGGRSGAWTGTLPASGASPVQLERGGAVAGVVRAVGAAPRSVVVEVASRPSASGWRTTDVHRFAGARFELGDLPDGTGATHGARRRRPARRGRADPRAGETRARDRARAGRALSAAIGERSARGAPREEITRRARRRSRAAARRRCRARRSRARLARRARRRGSPRGSRRRARRRGWNASRPICMGRFVAPLVPTTSRRSAAPGAQRRVHPVVLLVVVLVEPEHVRPEPPAAATGRRGARAPRGERLVLRARRDGGRSADPGPHSSAQRTWAASPWMQRTRSEPARRWSPSMFCVTSVKRSPSARSSATSASWPAFGRASWQTPKR